MGENHFEVPAARRFEADPHGIGWAAIRERHILGGRGVLGVVGEHEILGDAMVAAALIDRLIHHAHIITLNGKSYRLRERGSAAAPAAVIQVVGRRPVGWITAARTHRPVRYSVPERSALFGSC